MKKDGINKGFSLVEIIIVIAIGAILMGVVAPMLIRYIEKANVASDQALLDAVCTAVTYAALDPTVLEEADSRIVIQSFVDTPIQLETLEAYSDTKLYQETINTLGWDDLQASTYLKYIKSHHTSDSHIYMQYKGSADNPIAIWITHTDCTGGRDTSEDTVSSYTLIDKNIAIK